MRLKEYKENGTIDDLFKKGVISINHMTYFRYDQVFEAYRSKGFSKNKSRELAADECGCDQSTIKRAIKIVNR